MDTSPGGRHEGRSHARSPRAGHQALLTLARMVYSAAADGDLAHLDRAAHDFTDALGAHLRSEVLTTARITPGEERILRRGQARLWAAAHELLVEAGHGCGHSQSYCTSRAEELLALLTLQAHDEHRAFSRRAA